MCFVIMFFDIGAVVPCCKIGTQNWLNLIRQRDSCPFLHDAGVALRLDVAHIYRVQ